MNQVIRRKKFLFFVIGLAAISAILILWQMGKIQSNKSVLFAAVQTEGAAHQPNLGKSSSAPEQEHRKTTVEQQNIALLVRSRRKVSDTYALLEKAALSGDSQASYQLSLDMFYCSTIEQRAETINNFYQDSNFEKMSKSAEQQLEADLQGCDGVTKDQLKKKAGWVMLAARQGNTEAERMFFSAAMEEIATPEDAVRRAGDIVKIKEEAMNHLHDAARKGSEEAIFDIANAYHDGILVPASKVMAYAYMSVFVRSGKSPLVNNVLDKWKVEMSAKEIHDGDVLAANIIQKNFRR